jgi:hypothetical protein
MMEMEPKKKKGRPSLGDIPLTSAEKMSRRRERLKGEGVPHSASIDFQIANAVSRMATESSVPETVLEEIIRAAAAALERNEYERTVAETAIRKRLFRHKKI